MYKELVLELSKGNEWVKIQPPCPASVISEAEKVVGYSFPIELRNLLREMNGDGWLLLSAQQIIENVELNRKAFYPLFKEDFSIDAYKDRIVTIHLFCLQTDAAIIIATEFQKRSNENAIYIWEHEYIGDECCWKKVADNLAECITRYYNSEI